MSSAMSRLQEIKAQIETLKASIEKTQKNKEDEISWDRYGVPSSVQFNFSIRRSLRGHFGKIYSLDWAKDPNTLCSASQDGKVIIWNAFTENKRDAINLKSPWVMACAYEKETERLVACGGLDNNCTIWNVSSELHSCTELVWHEGYLSSCKFLGPHQILTSSGDSKIALWDLERNEPKQRFIDHSADVMSLAVHPADPNCFASCSCDNTVKIWDLRATACVRTFAGHYSDINAVEFFPSGNAVGSGSDDSSCRVFDLGSCGPIHIFTHQQVNCGVTDVCFSLSGRLMFSSYDDNFCIAWETISKEGTFHELRGHKNRVSCLGINVTGQALATGSWDTDLCIWA